MPERKNFALARSNTAQSSAHYQLDNDIELPGANVNDANQSAFVDESTNLNKSPSIVGKVFGVAVVAAAISIAGWFALNGSAEKQHDNWKHVASANETSTSDVSHLTHVNSSGVAADVQTIEVSRDDRDFVTTAAVRQALFSYDLNAANKALQDAQEIPLTSDPGIRQPTIEPRSQLESAIKRSRQEFFKVHVFDCCYEDGDVVEILVNGKSFVTVPITHKGTTLSIPLQPGSNTLTLRGVKDGRGGITVSFATSRGNYYCRAMAVGEQYTMGVVTR